MIRVVSNFQMLINTFKTSGNETSEDCQEISSCES